jgi:predicted PurR-regulated permease PerM
MAGNAHRREPLAESDRTRTPDHDWIVKVVFTAALIVAGLLAWYLTLVLVVVFAAIVVATILGIAASVTERFTPLKGRWAKAASWLVIAALIGGFVFLLGTQIAEQLSNLVTEFPRMVRQLGDLLGVEDLTGILRDRLDAFARQDGLFADVANATTNVVGIIAMLVLVLFAGFFLALDPDSYRHGVLQLVPDRYYAGVARALDNAGRALRLWLIGTLIAMLVVGSVTTAALYAIGLPSALALGVIAGVLEFVPFIGPILSVVPAILVAVPEGYGMVAWVIFIYLAIQQVEGNVLVPLIQHRTADLPPVVGILSIVAGAVLFGLPGVLLAVPLSIVIIVLVKQLYVRGTLGRKTNVPGEERPASKKRSQEEPDSPSAD